MQCQLHNIVQDMNGRVIDSNIIIILPPFIQFNRSTPHKLDSLSNAMRRANTMIMA